MQKSRSKKFEINLTEQRLTRNSSLRKMSSFLTERKTRGNNSVLIGDEANSKLVVSNLSMMKNFKKERTSSCGDIQSYASIQHSKLDPKKLLNKFKTEKKPQNEEALKKQLEVVERKLTETHNLKEKLDQMHQKRTEDLTVQKYNLVSTEKLLKQKIDNFEEYKTKIENNLIEKSSKLKIRENQLKSKEETFHQKRNNLNIKEKQLLKKASQQEKNLKSFQENLKMKSEDLLGLEKKLTIREASIYLKEKELFNKESELKYQEEDIVKTSSMFEKVNSELHQKSLLIEEEKKKIEHEWKEINKQSKALSYREKKVQQAAEKVHMKQYKLQCKEKSFAEKTRVLEKYEKALEIREKSYYDCSNFTTRNHTPHQREENLFNLSKGELRYCQNESYLTPDDVLTPKTDQDEFQIF